jgi:predicted RNase H-like HicB family nuclease
VQLTIVLESSGDGGFTAYVSALPGYFSEGETEEEAIANIREAIDVYLE